MQKLTDCLERYAVVSPGKTALVFGRESHTYLQLSGQVAELAHLLGEHGLGKNQTIGIQLPNSDSAVIGLFAIFRSGACAVIFNPLLHPREVATLSRNSDLSGMIVTPRQYDLLLPRYLDGSIPSLRKVVIVSEERFSLQKIEIKNFSSEGSRLPQFAESSDGLSGEDSALIIYTSGTTGTAKGVVLTHKNLLENSTIAVSLLDIGAADIALMTLPMCHVYGLTRQLFPHFLQGATVQLVSSSAPADLLNYKIDSERITTFSGVPYHFAGMLKRGAGTRYPMRTLRLATSASMPMKPQLRRALVQALPHTKFCCQYGLTEASGFVTALPHDLFIRKLDSVGRCIPGMEIKIAASDSEGLLAPNTDGVGELLVRGSGIMKGYYKDPEATAAAINSQGWLRTGDFARCDADGDVTIITRMNYLIKRAGEFIIPEEVEAIIAGHAAVVEACVFGIPDKDLGESVRAAVILKETANEREILDHCRENLAGFKIPEDVFFTDSLAKTAGGKMNRKAIVECYLASRHAR